MQLKLVFNFVYSNYLHLNDFFCLYTGWVTIDIHPYIPIGLAVIGIYGCGPSVKVSVTPLFQGHMETKNLQHLH